MTNQRAVSELIQLATLIRERSPHVFCSACTACALGMTEHDVRERLQVMVARPGLHEHFALTRRLCFGCGVVGDYVGLRR
jgi:hypothetical protein